MSGLAESLAQNAPAHAETRYAEIQLVSVDGYDVGFAMLEVDAGEGSERVIRRTSGLFSPEQPELGAQHDRVTTQVDGSGAIRSGRATGTKNGAPAYDVRIARTPDGYLVEGTASGKPISVRALAYVMAGHPRHHIGVLRERYGVA